MILIVNIMLWQCFNASLSQIEASISNVNLSRTKMKYMLPTKSFIKRLRLFHRVVFKLWKGRKIIVFILYLFRFLTKKIYIPKSELLIRFYFFCGLIQHKWISSSLIVGCDFIFLLIVFNHHFLFLG